MAVGGIVHAPCCEVVVCVLHGAEGTGEMKEHDSHSAPNLSQMREGSMEEENDIVIGREEGVGQEMQWMHRLAVS